MTTRKLTNTLLGAAALLGASTSFASVVSPTTGNGELVLFVYDSVLHTSYAKGLGVTLNDILAEGSVASTPAGTLATPAGLNVSLTGDANWTSFLGGVSSLDNVAWSVLGADSTGSNLVATPQRIVSTVVTGSGLPPSITNTSIKAGAGDLAIYFGIAGSAMDAFGNGNSVVGVGSQGPFYDESNNGNFSLGFSPDVLFGSTAQFYYAASSNTSGLPASGGSNPAKIYSLAGLTLTQSGLAVVGVSEVPLPAAVWLFGSGLLGMVGVGRRRRSTKAA